ncbi:MAG TPA: hypothetical protein VNT57_02175 [Desulfobacteria bacterium]|nr:hypothetical protein [Desulfobacteria bacterium]
MIIARFDSRDEEIRKLINQFAEICLSKEFLELKTELEQVYLRNDIENASLTAFQDAIYAILAQQEGARCKKLY